MTFEMIIFTASLVGILLLILIRMYELKSGKGILSRKSLDDRFEKVGKRVGGAFMRKFNSIFSFFNSMPSFARRTPAKMKVFLYKRFQKHVDLVKGRGVLHTKGSMPAFFSHANEHKKQLRNRG